MCLSVWLTVLLVPLSCAQNWQLVWEDTFDTLDLTKWDHEVTAWGGGNNEFQVYTPDPANSYVQDGKLFLKPTLLVNNINPATGQPFGRNFMNSGTLDLNTMYGRCTNTNNNGCVRRGSEGMMPPIMSARLRSAQRFAFKFGRVEIMAKMPSGDWMWPALWLLPEEWRYGGWPMSGEIDMMENIGNRDYVDGQGNYVGIQKMGSTLHWGISPSENRYYLTGAHTYNYTNNYADHFHKYAFEWDENGIRFYIDDAFLLSIPNPPINENPGFGSFYEYGKPWQGTNNPWGAATPMAPFDQEFHFLLNVAVGGTNGFITDNAINHGGMFPKPWSNSDWYGLAMQKFYAAESDWYWTWEEEGDNAAMQIDSVRVWQRV